MWYLNRLDEAVQEVRRAVEQARQVGGLQVQVFAQQSPRYS